MVRNGPLGKDIRRVRDRRMIEECIRISLAFITEAVGFTLKVATVK